jgi:hypothetical protein
MVELAAGTSSDWTSWQVWGWPGWVAFAAVGTVGALAILGYQAWLQRGQSVAEAEQRRQDERHRREDFQFEHTPLVTASGTANVSLHGQQDITVELTLYADGASVAYNVIANLFAFANGGQGAHLGHPVVVAQMRPPTQTALTFTYTAAEVGHDWQHALPHQVRLEVGFYNMFGQRIAFRHSCTVDAEGIEITNPPEFTLPWEFAGR